MIINEWAITLELRKIPVAYVENLVIKGGN